MCAVSPGHAPHAREAGLGVHDLDAARLRAQLARDVRRPRHVRCGVGLVPHDDASVAREAELARRERRHGRRGRRRNEGGSDVDAAERAVDGARERCVRAVGVEEVAGGAGQLDQRFARLEVREAHAALGVASGQGEGWGEGEGWVRVR
jgi:hypothetical protein